MDEKEEEGRWVGRLGFQKVEGRAEEWKVVVVLVGAGVVAVTAAAAVEAVAMQVAATLGADARAVVS